MFLHGHNITVTVIARWSVGRAQLSASFIIVYLVYFSCVFYLSLVHFYEFFSSTYLHIIGSVADRVCWVNEVAVLGYSYILLVTVILGWPLLAGSCGLIKWHFIHLISCCLLPPTYCSMATSWVRGRIIQLELGSWTNYLARVGFVDE